VVFDKETEEVGEVDEAFEFFHVVLEIFLTVSVFPVFYGLRAKSKDLIDSVQSTERVEDVHFGNVAEHLFARVVIRVLDINVNNVIFVLDFFKLHVGANLRDSFDGNP
jgi:hypothetical protein